MKLITTTVAALACAAAACLANFTAVAAEATFYQLPPGAYPHDVAPAPDGRVWYSGQQRGFLGRFDPKTGKNEEIALGPGAAPHGVDRRTRTARPGSPKADRMPSPASTR